ncbi:MAG TPA: NfeD family protein [Candidatus Polarisedimenticolaceae bacterium]|nr:NfeD family protein [Candidatus Polarisedimenticolaceae bacterium]
MSLGHVYIGLLLLGVVYALIAGALGWLSDLGGGDIHLDASGHLDAGHAHPISGTIVATFITGFGGGGIVAHYLLHLAQLGSLTVAMLSGLVLAAAAFAVLEFIFKQTQAGSEFSLEQLVGREAEVITSIPAGATGEVSYVMKGQREQGAARSTDGAAIARGRRVTIEKVSGSTFYVRPKD